MATVFSIERNALLNALQLVGGVLERRQTLPILSHVLLSLKEIELTVTATDLEIELVARATLAEAVPKATQLTVPGRKLLDICRALPDGAMLTLSCQKDKLCLKSDLAQGASKFNLAMLPANDFPTIEMESDIKCQFSMTQRSLKALLQKTQFAMAQQDVRHYLNGLLFEIRDRHIRVVATDGHRLAMSGVVVDHQLEPRQVIIPRKGVSELARFLGVDDEPVEIHISHHYLSIHARDFQFTSKLIDHRFPDYQRALPKGGDKVIHVNRELLKASLSRAAILSNEKFRGISLKFDKNEMQIKANNPEQEIAEERLALDYDGEGFEIGFNVNYLLDVLNTLNTDLVVFTFSDATSSVEVRGEDQEDESLYVVMPLRL